MAEANDRKGIMPRKRKQFKGWAIRKSKTGSDWGQKWPIVSKVVKTKREARDLVDKRQFERHYDCLPYGIFKIYR
jgi:hypothetical protein